jgi:predicted aldo/keto reductase-like oxidoreductase
MDRREFLKRATQAAAAVTVSSGITSEAATQEKAVTLADAIPTRVFGTTGLELPILGYGGAGLVTEWGSPLSIDDRVELVRYSYGRGVRYFDTAGNYRECQSILGEALKDVREDVCLATKVETTDPGEVRKAVEKSLEELQADYIDIILIHGTPGLEHMSVERAMKIHGELLKLRDEGIARFIGFSAHSYFDKALALISSGGFDHCMLSYGYVSRGYDQLHSDKMIEVRNACIAQAHKQGMGIVAMKVMGAGVLGAWSRVVAPKFNRRRHRQLPGAAIRYVLQDKRIHLLTIGMRLKAEVASNIKMLSGNTAYTPDDQSLLEEFLAQAQESDPIKAMRIE